MFDWMSVVELFSNCYLSYSFSPIFTKLGTHIHQTVEQIFEIFL